MSVSFRLALLVSIGLVLSGAAFAQDSQALGGRAMPPNPDWLIDALHWTARGIETVGIAIILLGAIVSSFYFLWQLLKAGVLAGAYHAYRANLGRGHPARPRVPHRGRHHRHRRS
jgi:hypothetical protein